MQDGWINSLGISPSALLLGLAVYYGCLWLFLKYRLRLRGIRLPPGPTGSFIAGNLTQIPKVEPWLTYTSWSKIYGPIVYYRVFNNKTIILNSAKATIDLLESRSTIYSERPTSWMSGELAKRKYGVFSTSFSDPRHKSMRKLLQQGLNSRAAKSYRPIQMEETLVLLRGLKDNPTEFAAHIRRNAVAVIMKVAYGYQVESNDDRMVRYLEDAFTISASMNVPGKYWVEFFPILRFLPEWFPGAGFKRLARELGKTSSRVESIPFQWTLENMAKGDFIESFTSKHLHIEDGQLPTDRALLEEIKWCSAALYIGGGDTTVSALTTFFLIMSLYPDVQKRAQKDVDEVAPDRLPTLDDFESLPYIRAMIKEILRWAPVAPLGIPHKAMVDDIYENYFVPKGTRVIGNIWAITHDEDLYPNPHIFDPTRHLGDSPQADPFKFVFGFGRRFCPGAHLAEMSLFLNISNILAAFDISKPLDKNGVTIEPSIAWTTGITSHLKPFDCQIIPRPKNVLLEI
ncbi:Cytochrome P450 monooxygenase 208 [Psilocybe cubensis]|uniref:Cytochrome P450 monooxygenase 208 n=2 Tax=Psilocybe cubensis TaxID=181762 RepID=A0ACB8H3D7_PSICU|nr:Cytochrome P450 monooxygenase 208 [Psilocybe cubensis]KAH9482219.1 Cytochrome P450 monooxygenase 208 [Psilocybe cubensis]